MRVQRRYAFAHSPGLTPRLRRTYRTTDRRVPWLVRAAEGAEPGLRAELDALAAANVLRQNTVIVHGTALAPEDGVRLAAARVSLVWCPESDRRLYGRTAPVGPLRAAGVRVGLGTDAPPAGARDALSNLAAARREGVLDDAALLRLATLDSAAVARLAPGGLEEGAPADLLAADSPERLLEGDRLAVALVVVRGEARVRRAGARRGGGPAGGAALGGRGAPGPRRAPRAAPRHDPAPPPGRARGVVALGSRAIIRHRPGELHAGAARDPVRDGRAEGEGARPPRAAAGHGGPRRQGGEPRVLLQAGRGRDPAPLDGRPPPALRRPARASPSSGRSR